MDHRIEVSDLTEHDVTAFLENPVWRCLSTDIRERLNATMEQMKMAPSEDIWGSDDKGRYTLMVSGTQRLGGMAREDDAILMFPQSYIDELKAINEEIKQDKEGENNATTNE